MQNSKATYDKSKFEKIDRACFDDLVGSEAGGRYSLLIFSIRKAKSNAFAKNVYSKISERLGRPIRTYKDLIFYCSWTSLVLLFAVIALLGIHLFLSELSVVLLLLHILIILLSYFSVQIQVDSFESIEITKIDFIATQTMIRQDFNKAGFGTQVLGRYLNPLGVTPNGIHAMTESRLLRIWPLSSLAGFWHAVVKYFSKVRTIKAYLFKDGFRKEVLDEYDSYTLSHLKKLTENIVVYKNDMITVEKLVLLRESQVIFSGNQL